MRVKSEDTGFPRIDAVIASVEQANDWHCAKGDNESHFYQLLATIKLNIHEPYTAEQAALNGYLSVRRAGKRLCDYAWRSYAQSIP